MGNKLSFVKEKDVVVGVVVLAILFVFLLIGVPTEYTPLHDSHHRELVYEFVATYLSFGLFLIFIARFFFLYNQGLLFLGVAFISTFIADMIRSYGLTYVDLPLAQYQILQAMTYGTTKIVFIIMLLLSAFRYDRITRKESIVSECIRYIVTISVITALTALTIIIFMPKIITQTEVTKSAMYAAVIFSTRILLMGASAVIATRFYYQFLRKKNKLLLWFTVAVLLSIASDLYFMTYGEPAVKMRSIALILTIMSYSTFAIGMMDDYIQYLLKEKEISTNLEKIIVKRTEELQMKNRELEKRTKESLEASRLKSELLANMSHELRTPMNAIIGFTHRVIKKCKDLLPERQLKNLKTVERNAHHLLSLINSILDVSKVEAGRMEVLVEPFCLHELVEDVIDMTTPLVGDKPLKLLYECPKEIYINSDRTKIKQMLINLVGNSLKFTEEGGVKISARRTSNVIIKHGKHDYSTNVFGKQSVQVKKRSNEYIQLVVSDTGVGIKEDALPYIFDEFRQVDGSLTRKTGGTGLGLAIVQKFSVLLGGDVRVESKHKKGTSFIITLPIDSSFASKSKSQIEQEKRGEKVTHSIMCVTENDRLEKLAKEQVESVGFLFDTAKSAEEIIEKARERRPVVIAIDMMLPQHTYFEAIQEIKADPAVATCPVVSLSVLNDESKAYGICCADYVAKPINQRTIIEATYRAAVYHDIKTILIVDDSDESRETIKGILEEEKRYSLIVAHDGEEALQHMKTQKPELVFLDLIMPKMDGFSLLEKLQREGLLHESHIVIMTPKDLDPRETEAFRNRIEQVIGQSKQDCREVMSMITSVAKM